jgi:hypothetical protein
MCRHGTIMEVWFSSAGCAVHVLVPKHYLSVRKSHNVCVCCLVEYLLIQNSILRIMFVSLVLFTYA